MYRVFIEILHPTRYIYLDEDVVVSLLIEVIVAVELLVVRVVELLVVDVEVVVWVSFSTKLSDLKQLSKWCFWMSRLRQSDENS